MKPSYRLFGFFIIGILLVGISIFVGHSGFTLHVSWNLRRVALLVLGVAITFSTLLYYFFRDNLTGAVRRAELAIESHPFTRWWKKSQLIDRNDSSRLAQVYLLTVICSVLIILIYVWFISAGQWTNWPRTTSYYDQLGSSFMDGQLSLKTTPDPALLALSNPYDPNNQVRIPIDFALYKGKFYLYFGPVPAVLLAMIKPVLSKEIGDPYMVFAFTLGIYFFQCLLAVSIWYRYFPDIPLWMLLICLPLLGLINPLLYMLVTARIYESAIAAGQFFLMGGFFFATTILDKPRISRAWLIVAGLFWTLSLGSRIILSLSVGFMVVMTMFWMIRSTDRTKIRDAIKGATAIVLPLVLGMACLGWYNYARFGSVFETGINYMNLMQRLKAVHGHPSGLAYIPQNLYNYLLNPPRILSAFPFFSADGANLKSIIPLIKLPATYSGEQITGSIYSTPFILFALIPFILLFSKPVDISTPPGHFGNQNNDTIKWLSISLAGSFLLTFVLFVLFFWASMRYIADFMPSLILLSVLGFWQGYRFLLDRPIQRVIYTLFGVGLAGVSILMSNLLTFSINLWWIDHFG